MGSMIQKETQSIICNMVQYGRHTALNAIYSEVK